jgi:hypothetical protein
MDTITKPIIAIDIEKAGKGFEHSLLAIGICLGDDKGNVIEKKTWCFKGDCFELRCFNEFWSKYKDLLNTIMTKAIDIKEGLFDFMLYMESLESRYSNKLLILSDNPNFDIGQIDYYIYKHLDRHQPLRYTKSGGYRSISDPSEMMNNRSFSEDLYKELDLLVKHDHWPENDAEYIYQNYILYKKYISVSGE